MRWDKRNMTMKVISLLIKTALITVLFVATSHAHYISFPPNGDLAPFNDITMNAPFEQIIDGQMIKGGQEISPTLAINKAKKSTPIFAPTAIPNDIGIVALILFIVFICLVRKSNNLI